MGRVLVPVLHNGVLWESSEGSLEDSSLMSSLGLLTLGSVLSGGAPGLDGEFLLLQVLGQPTNNGRVCVVKHTKAALSCL